MQECVSVPPNNVVSSSTRTQRSVIDTFGLWHIHQLEWAFRRYAHVVDAALGGYTLITLPRILTPYRDRVDETRARLTLRRRIKSHLLFAGIVRSSPFSPR